MKAALPRLVLMAPGELHARVIGIRAVPQRLPEVLRLPGESLGAMTARARLMVRHGDATPIAVFPLLKNT